MNIINQSLLSQVNQHLDPTESIPEFPLDGNFYHFKNGKREPSSSHVWAIGQAWEYKGNVYQWVKVGDWRSGTSTVLKSYDPQNETKSSNTYADKFIKEAEQKSAQAKEERHKDCAEKWEPIFRAATPNAPIHAYSAFKKLKGNFCGRVRADSSTLLIPIEHPEHGFVGCQQIWKKDGQFLKIFTKGLRISGSFTRLTDFDVSREQLVYLTEGFSTAGS